MKNVIARIKLESGFSSKFQSNILREVTKKIKRKAPKIQNTIRESLKTIVSEALISTPEYQSILQGKLKAELGIPNPDYRISAIIEKWVDNIQVKIKVGTNPLLLIDIGIIREDYGDVLSLAESQYTYKTERAQGEIPWLRWLLLEGDKRIITKYEFSSNQKGSRTGRGIMIKKDRGFWQVPPEFSGTSVDNFATRAFGNIGDAIDKIVEQAVKGALK